MYHYHFLRQELSILLQHHLDKLLLFQNHLDLHH